MASLPAKQPVTEVICFENVQRYDLTDDGSCNLLGTGMLILAGSRLRHICRPESSSSDEAVVPWSIDLTDGLYDFSWTGIEKEIAVCMMSETVIPLVTLRILAPGVEAEDVDLHELAVLVGLDWLPPPGRTRLTMDACCGAPLSKSEPVGAADTQEVAAVVASAIERGGAMAARGVRSGAQAVSSSLNIALVRLAQRDPNLL